jgi:hypothetical protein
MRASITQGDVVLLADVQVSLVNEPGAGAWSGYVLLPPGAELIEGEYVLRSDDGRSGPIMVMSVREGVARFRGVGPVA